MRHTLSLSCLGPELIVPVLDVRQQSEGNHLCKAGHNRYMTVFVYLNDCAEGGCTTFPRIGLHYGTDGGSFYDNPGPFNITGLEFISQRCLPLGGST